MKINNKINSFTTSNNIQIMKGNQKILELLLKNLSALHTQKDILKNYATLAPNDSATHKHIKDIHIEINDIQRIIERQIIDAPVSKKEFDQIFERGQVQ